MGVLLLYANPDFKHQHQLGFPGEGAGLTHPKHPLPATQHPPESLLGCLTLSFPPYTSDQRKSNAVGTWGLTMPSLLFARTKTILSSAAIFGTGREHCQQVFGEDPLGRAVLPLLHLLVTLRPCTSN